MRAEIAIFGPLNVNAIMDLGRIGDTVSVIDHVTLAHGFVFLVVANNDHNRKIIGLGCTKRLDDRIVEERPITDEQNDRTVFRSKLCSERCTNALP